MITRVDIIFRQDLMHFRAIGRFEYIVTFCFENTFNVLRVTNSSSTIRMCGVCMFAT